jgi:hypothetical protein
MQGVTYQKLITWKDLNIGLANKNGDDVYRHPKEKELHDNLANNSNNFIKKMMDFKPLEPDVWGIFNFQDRTENSIC